VSSQLVGPHDAAHPREVEEDPRTIGEVVGATVVAVVEVVAAAEVSQETEVKSIGASRSSWEILMNGRKKSMWRTSSEMRAG